MELEFRELDEADLDFCADLERQAGDAGWSRDHFKRERALSFSRFFVARRGGKPVAFGGYWRVAGEAQITNVAVLPEMRRQGVATALVEFLLREARRDGCRRSTLEARAGNTAARRLYAKAGYREVGRRRGAYTRPDDDAVLFERDLE